MKGSCFRVWVVCMAMLVCGVQAEEGQPARAETREVPGSADASAPVEPTTPAGDPSSPAAGDAATEGAAAKEGDAAEPTAEDLQREANRKEWEARNKAAGLPRHHLQPDHADNTALAGEVRILKEVWLESLAEESQFLLLERKERTGTPQGAALLIPGVDQHGDWPNVLRPVSERLAEIGWFSFSLSMPYLVRDLPPKRALAVKQFDEYRLPTPSEDGTREGDESGKTGEGGDSQQNAATEEPESEAGAESDSEISAEASAPAEGGPAPAGDAPAPAEGGVAPVQIDLSDSGDKTAGDPVSLEAMQQTDAPPVKLRVPLREAVASRVDASFEHIKQAGYENIVFIAVGNGADSMLDFLVRNKGKIPARGFAMIWVAPEFSGDVGARVEEALEGFPAPLLDIYDSIVLTERDLAYERRLIARGQKVKRYHLAQMPLSGPAIEKKRRMLPYRISSWLQKNAPGTKARKVAR